ncbi:MAG: hypothetical protein IPG64_16405 [Haliea sp.]|nr:hypothetical protein [Haliea sp.]
MSEQVIKISDDFLNIRGDFNLGGLLNIGTHSSLVRRRNGKWVLLDAYTLPAGIKATIDAQTNNGNDIEAIINLHPFHTIHVAGVHKQYPNAKLYGTRRHHENLHNLPWQPERIESGECAALFVDDFEFSIPVGVDFISQNEKVHFSSAIAYHRASKTIHVDDTLTYLALPGLLGKLKKPEIAFHFTLSKALEKRAGAAEDFRAWVRRLASEWSAAENLCAAHSATLLGSENRSASIAERIMSALASSEKTLYNHESKYG